MRQILSESVLLTGVAGGAGLVLGVVLTEVSNAVLQGGGDTFLLNPTVGPQEALLALGILVTAGAFAGLMPAHRALSVQPVDALRAE